MLRSCTGGQTLGIPLVDAVRMASRNPAQFLKLGDRMGRIAPGQRADLVLVDDGLNVLETWIGAQVSESASALIESA